MASTPQLTLTSSAFAFLAFIPPLLVEVRAFHPGLPFPAVRCAHCYTPRPNESDEILRVARRKFMYSQLIGGERRNSRVSCRPARPETLQSAHADEPSHCHRRRRARGRRARTSEDRVLPGVS